jgi:hypothetical protein
LTGRPRVTASLDELLEGASTREPLVHGDAKSGARFERVRIGGRDYVLKHVRRDDDWIMRATGDLAYRTVRVWSSGLLDSVPECIDHTVAGAAITDDGAALLMRDVSQWLVPEGDLPIPLDQHLRFLDHMAALHAAFWDWDDQLGLTPLSSRYLWFAPCVIECERARGFPDAVPRIMDEGWQRFPSVAPRAAEVVMPLLDDPDPLIGALESTPHTLLHGDWKLGNLGSHPDGRTILVDWAVPGAGPACADLAWYVALNRKRLPEGQSKEDAVVAYRQALEQHGVDTGPWWEQQLAVCLLGALVQFGWEKAFDESEELAWWGTRALEGAKLLR